MANILGVSGSTIYSNPEQFSELFWEGVEHIEIGEFPDKKGLDAFLALREEKPFSFGIHSPLFRSGSKYDLLEEVHNHPAYAWKQLELEAAMLSSLGARYLLIHFPYFMGEIEMNSNEMIEEGLKKLSVIQQSYGIELVCEPKLGLNRSDAGIEYLNEFSVEIWAKYGIKLCIDIGDYMIATNEKAIEYIVKWRDFIKVVHLHNIYFEGEKYIWIPVHPSQEHGDNYKVAEIIKALAYSKNIMFIFEHTPETNPSKAFVKEGFKWVNELIKLEK